MLRGVLWLFLGIALTFAILEVAPTLELLAFSYLVSVYGGLECVRASTNRGGAALAHLTNGVAALISLLLGIAVVVSLYFDVTYNQRFGTPVPWYSFSKNLNTPLKIAALLICCVHIGYCIRRAKAIAR